MALLAMSETTAGTSGLALPLWAVLGLGITYSWQTEKADQKPGFWGGRGGGSRDAHGGFRATCPPTWSQEVNIGIAFRSVPAHPSQAGGMVPPGQRWR